MSAMIETKDIPFYKTMPPEEALKRAKDDYLAISRNKNNPSMYREYNYWPAEEMAWERLQEAIERVEASKNFPPTP